MASIQRWIAAIFIFGSPGLAILILLVAAPRLTSDRPRARHATCAPTFINRRDYKQ
jgi:hypothetical protein